MIDRAFFTYLQNILELDDDLAGVGDGGHFVISAMANNVLQRFIHVKHLFGGEGETNGDIQLTRDWDKRVVDSPKAKSKVKGGVLRLSR